MRMQATWNGAVLAESEETIVVEGNHYFPRSALSPQYFEENAHHTVCPWKGVAHYYDVVVDGTRNPSAAWYYPKTSHLARKIEDYVAFWKGVQVKQAKS